MPSKLDRIYVRITPADRERIDYLCSIEGDISASALIRKMIGSEYREKSGWDGAAPKKKKIPK